MNQKSHDVKPNPVEERRFKVTFGTGLFQAAGTWKDQRELSWPELVEILTAHKEGKKDGTCVVPAVFREPERKQEYADEISLLVLDSDCGHTLEEIAAPVKQRGYGAGIYSTHSHLTTVTTISRLDYEKFNGTPEQYLIDRKNYLPRVATGAKIISKNADEITFGHEKCPKYRVVLRLDRSWKATDYTQQEEANDAWRRHYKTAARHLGLSIDPSCSDPNRLFFLPRHKRGAPFESLVIEGSDIPIWDLPVIEDERAQTKEPPRQQTQQGDQPGVIGAFNERVGIERVLERNGYKKIGSKYLAPTSSSKMPGIAVKDGRAFSHHQSDPLYTGDDQRSHDAFGAFRILEHNGDMRRAVKAAAEELGLERAKNTLINKGKTCHGAGSREMGFESGDEFEDNQNIEITNETDPNENVSSCQHSSANVSSVSAKCQQLKNALKNAGLSEEKITDLTELYSRESEREFDPGRLEELCLDLSNIILSANVSKYPATITQAVREWVTGADGCFNISDIYRDLAVSERKEKLCVQQALGRICSEGLIERHGDRKGAYRITVEPDLDKLDWQNVRDEVVPLVWPFGIEQRVELMPGNIACVAGEPNSGKTAMLLNLVRLNMTKFKIDYFSSEMGAGELKKRLLNFQPTIGPTDWTFNAWECNSNFANAIKPGAGNLNVIDFLEIHKDFWEVGGFLADIHSRLKGAIAVVALQKNPGSEFGLGGGRGLEKPRLYLSMSRDGVCKIVKAKNWRTSENPNGLQLNYKLVQGCHFYVYRDWYREERK